MKESKIYIKYKVGNKIYEDDLYQNQHYTIEANADGDNGVRFVFVPREKIELVSFELKYLRKTVPGEKFFVNGYQAWTTSREMGADDVQKGLTPLAKVIPFAKVLLELTGDYAFTEYSGKPGRFHSFTYTYFRKENVVELYGSLNERTRMAVRESASSRDAVTTFRVLERFEPGPKDDGYTLVDCKLFTGRTHQIRVHMEFTRHPLVGDPMYTAGAPSAPQANLGLDRQFLHSFCLEFEHPITGKHLSFADALPMDLLDVLENLKARSEGRTEAGKEIHSLLADAPRSYL